MASDVLLNDLGPVESLKDLVVRFGRPSYKDVARALGTGYGKSLGMSTLEQKLDRFSVNPRIINTTRSKFATEFWQVHNK
jgi:hypothetical protein